MIEHQKTSRREVTLPAPTLVALLASARAAGDAALRDQGRIAGRLLAERLVPSGEQKSARELPTSVFWKRISELFATRGWGRIQHADAGPGLGELHSTDWIEADRAGSGGRCGFTAGLLRGLLEEVSGAELEVEETECRAAGGSACRFVFGTRAAVAARAASAAPTA